MNTITAHVVVAGAGPTGLMLACELALAGLPPLVLERLAQPTGLSKALALNGRAVDSLDLRGLLDRFSQTSAQPSLASFTHFGGIPLDLSRLSGERPRTLFIKQARVEQLLEERARELGVEIRRGHSLTDLQQHATGVTVDVVPEAGGPYEIEAQFLVGCDGGASTVRRAAGIGFPGTEPTSLLRLGDVELDLDESVRLPFGVAPLGDGVFRVITREPYPAGFDRETPMELDELRESARRVFGIDMRMSKPRWLSRFTDASRQADRYRAGNVLVAGDAAHIHLPAGGPGLSTGLQDAVNLGWKLAATISGVAAPGLLDTYHAERHPAGRQVLMHTRAQSVLLGPGEHAAALREVFAELLTFDDALRYIVDLVQGTDTRYELPQQDGQLDPLVGRWLPDLIVETDHGTCRSAELLHAARGVLLTSGDAEGLLASAAPWRDRVDCLRARCTAAGVAAPGVVLVRPDGYVAWAVSPGELEKPRAGLGLPAALERWFGPARCS
jgi:2-polyprenyl-6-methoxyphenol hydroxylase-like FAD-dependent oxidoreductase